MTSQAILGDNPIVVNKLESSSSKSSTVSKTNKESFQKVMNRSNEGQKLDDNRPVINDRRPNDNTDRINNGREIPNKIREHLSKEHDKTNNGMPFNPDKHNNPFLKEKFISNVKDLINDIADIYKEALDIDDEELINVMEQLGINLFQLPLEDVIKEIVLKANGEEDITGLLVNENALNSLNQITEFLDKLNIDKKLDMSATEFNDLVNEAIERLNNGELVGEELLDNEVASGELVNEELIDNKVVNNDLINTEMVENQLSNTQVNSESINSNPENIADTIPTDSFINEEDNTLLIKSDIQVSEDKTISVEISKELDTTNQLVNNSYEGQVNVENENNIVPSMENVLQNTDDAKLDNLDMNTKNIKEDIVNSISDNKINVELDNSKGEDLSDMMSNEKELGENIQQSSNTKTEAKEAATEFYDKFIDNLENSLGINKGDLIKEMSHIREMREVVAQLVDKIKVNINKDSTSMKMMLAPEHLGKLELEVTSKSGVMTAKFVVESVTAKEAVENGLQILVKKFEEQGLKVEAVEVSIANYDMNKEHGRDKGSKDYEMDIKKKKRHGKITLDEINAMETTENETEENNEVRRSMTATTIDYAV